MGIFDAILPTAATGIIGSFFGKKPNSAYAAAQQQAMGNLASDRGGYDSLRASDSGDYSLFHPRANKAITDYGNYLEQDPETDQNQAAEFGRLSGHMMDAYLGTGGDIVRSMLSRGFSPDSSAAIGANIANGNDLARSRSQAYSDIYSNNLAQRQARLGALASLFTGAAGTARGNTASDIGSEAGIDQGLATMNGNLAAQEQARTDEYNGQMAGAVGGIGNAIGKYYGGRAGARPDPFTAASSGMPDAGTSPGVQSVGLGSTSPFYTDPSSGPASVQPGLRVNAPPITNGLGIDNTFTPSGIQWTANTRRNSGRFYGPSY